MKKFGLSAFEDRRAAFDDLSATILQQQASELNTQLEVFQSALSYFAAEHAADIRTNPGFRSEFAKMCTAIGVDPLAGSSGQGSLWASALGKDVNDFYFELAVRVIEICKMAHNDNGGIMSVAEVRARLADKSQLRPIEVSEDDIEQSVRTLKHLGGGFELMDMGSGKTMIRSVPLELSGDQSSVLAACQVLGYVSVGMLHDNLGWSRARSKSVLDDMIGEGLLWVDSQAREITYWAPSWIG